LTVLWLFPLVASSPSRISLSTGTSSSTPMSRRARPGAKRERIIRGPPGCRRTCATMWA